MVDEKKKDLDIQKEFVEIQNKHKFYSERSARTEGILNALALFTAVKGYDDRCQGL